MPPPTQLIVYAFAPGTRFEGHLVGALERLESGGSLRVKDVLFVQRDSAGERLVAFEHHGAGAGGFVERLLSFRLDAGERDRATRRALDGVAGPALRELGEDLEPGGALAAVFLEHIWMEVLGDAVARTGGTLVGDRFVDAEVLASELAAKPSGEA